MKEADLWEPIARLYRPLPVPKTKVRQNMSEDEERRFLQVALDLNFVHGCWQDTAWWLWPTPAWGSGSCDTCADKTCFSQMTRHSSKLTVVTRMIIARGLIPLNFLALRSMRWIVKRWENLGGTAADQYILPHHARRTTEEKSQRGHAGAGPIFTEPMGHIYRAARESSTDAGLGHLDPYDMRSHAITKLLSNPEVSDQMYTEIVGHVGNAMKRRYSTRTTRTTRTTREEAGEDKRRNSGTVGPGRGRRRSPCWPNSVTARARAAYPRPSLAMLSGTRPAWPGTSCWWSADRGPGCGCRLPPG